MRGREFHACTINLSSRAAFGCQIDSEFVSKSRGHGGVTEPNLAVKCHIKLGVQAHCGEFNPVPILLGRAKMENLNHNIKKEKRGEQVDVIS